MSVTGTASVVYWDRGRRLLGPRASFTGTAGVSPAASAKREKPLAEFKLRRNQSRWYAVRGFKSVCGA